VDVPGKCVRLRDRKADTLLWLWKSIRDGCEAVNSRQICVSVSVNASRRRKEAAAAVTQESLYGYDCN
jgi:hypothetical protein